ncbi:MAG: hypothetical protein ACRBB6_07330 [Neptuniibacter sp.]
MTKSHAYTYCSAKHFDLRFKSLTLKAMFLLLSITAYSVSAEEGTPDLPELYSEAHPFAIQTDDSYDQESQQKLKLIEDYLKQVTSKQLTNSSSIYLAPKGVKIETDYQNNISTEIKTDTENITFTFKLSF